ncbi:MAG TPA: carbamate kinase [Symbiobacteriaceae bacterium]|nr:carbamate kinase [Symbiobacteriaceae bacterium]
MGYTVVIALGGNAILQPGQRGTVAEQRANIATACEEVARVLAGGHRVILTHGNGPQVGNILLQNEEARAVVPPCTLDLCGAQSQGLIGYLFQQELQRRTGRPAVSLVTQVVVDPADPAFTNPTKPVGPFYTPDAALRLQEERGWAMKEDAGRGWRRVVPSPEPRRVVEVEAIRRLADGGGLVVACGGGGVPVAEDAGTLSGLEAVIDKDLTAAVLARDLGAELLVILTDVDAVALHYGRPAQRPLGAVTVAELERHAADGHFRAGSMRPKVEAAVRFVRGGGTRAAIASLARAAEAVAGSAGTQVTP